MFVVAGELRAFDHTTDLMRVVGPVEGVAAALGFDDLGKVLLVVRPTDPIYGTFSVADGRLTSAIRLVPRDPSGFGRALGLVRINVSR